MTDLWQSVNAQARHVALESIEQLRAERGIALSPYHARIRLDSRRSPILAQAQSNVGPIVIEGRGQSARSRESLNVLIDVLFRKCAQSWTTAEQVSHCLI